MTANGVISALEVLDARIGATNTPPLGDTNLGSSPERAAIIAAVEASFDFPKTPADLSKKDIVPLDHKAFEDVEFFCNEVEAHYEKKEQEFIDNIAREIKSMDQKETHTIKRTYNGHPIVIVVGPEAHAHKGEYGCGKMGKKSEFGPYAVFGKSSGIKEFIQKIFFGLPKAFSNVQPDNKASKVEIAPQVPAPKPKQSLLSRIFSCFCCCFGRRK